MGSRANAIALAQSGQHAEARRLLEQIAEVAPDLEAVWLWLATVAPDRAERMAFLERALAINPDNATTRAAYAKLAGKPPEPLAPPSRKRPAQLEMRTRDAPVSRGNVIMILAVGVVAVFVVVLAVNLRGEATGPRTPPAPLFNLPTATWTPRMSPTPSRTLRPTNTPGPSPTSIWDTPPPTWTVSPTRPPLTPSPSPTLPPRPTNTASFTPLLPTATFTRIPPTDTPTPAPATQTAAFALTSDAPGGDPARPASATATPLPSSRE